MHAVVLTGHDTRDELPKLLNTSLPTGHRRALFLYNDVIMSTMAFVQAQIKENKHQSSASLAFVRGVHR